MADRITVYDESGKKLVLGANDHLATGGEGAVYARGDIVYKVYLDPCKARAARLEDKLALLKPLRRPGIAAPTGALRDSKGLFVGMTFERVEGEALCRLFTNTWRDAHGFGLDQTRKVVGSMRDIVSKAHQHQALLVDGNELNWLVAPNLRPTVIDVDSWQVQGFPATAIMPSVRDPLSPQFTTGSDWFTWAIVTFQLWTGIHPYKGTHPDFARTALAERMKARASVFDPRVRVPAAVRDFNDIPKVLRDWYQSVFDGTTRTVPPSPDAPAVPLGVPKRLRVTQSSTSTLRIERLGAVSGKVRAAFNGFILHENAGQLMLWDALSRRALTSLSSAQCEKLLQRQAAVTRLPAGEPVWLELHQAAGRLEALRADAAGSSTAPSSLPTTAQRLWQSGNRVFALIEGASEGLVELQAAALGSRLAVTAGRQWPVSVLSSQLLQGVLVQDCLGTPFVGVLEGEGLVLSVCAALKGYQVIEGFGLDRHNIWLSAVRKRDGETVRLQLRWAADRFDVLAEDVTSDPTIEAVALQTGVGLVRLGTQLHVLKGRAGKLVDVSGIADDARLFSLGSGVGVFEGSDISKVSLL